MPHRTKILSSNNIIKLQGVVDFNNVGSLYDEGIKYIKPDITITLDLQDLIKANSSGISLLLQWLKVAHSLGTKINIINAPKFFVMLIKVYNLEDLLVC